MHVTYITCIWKNFGVLPSISDSWYSLKRDSALFTFYMWALGLSIAIIGGYSNNVFYFLSGSCLCFTGGAAEFKQKMTGTVHVVGAVGGIALVFAGQLYVSIWVRHEGLKFGAEWNQLVWYLISVVAIACTATKNKTWWFENAALVFAVLGLLIEYNQSV